MSSVEIIRDEAAARNRFENFKLGNGPAPTHRHSRSHSRNTSVSSFSFPKTTTVNDLSSFPQTLLSTPIASPSPSPTALSQPIPPSKRNSHHRRRSSVSTRHESAEMMGVALPDLPQSTSDDNINLGEKDSIRRRALWALEGKPDVSFNKVEIPDISTPDIEKMMFDFSNKSSFQSGPASTYGNPLIGNKRDSFKLLGPSSSAKDQLHTLVEEEEEDDDSVELPLADIPSSIKENVPPPTPALAITNPTPAKHRPSNLNLRPLSLTPENLISMAPSLPSPSPTPSPRTGLRSLSLTPSSSIEEPPNNVNTKQSRRIPLAISPSPAPRRPILNLALEQLENSPNSSANDERTPRRSSISYKRSSAHGGVTMNMAGLPTPEMTPTFCRRYSTTESLASTGADDEFFPNPPTQTRPLSASEQHFLYKSHNALLARINDLERVLMRRRESGGYSNGLSSRPLSVASNVSSTGMDSAAGSEPSDEMLRLIADLKAERDELKRDVDGWRTRVGDMENQMSVLAKRVENERRDAWVARSRVGLLEVEKGVLMKKMEAVDELIEKEKGLWEQEKQVLKEENAECKNRIGKLVSELEGVKKELEIERLKKEEADSLSTPTPRTFDPYSRSVVASKHGLGFMSVDSECSITDTDSSDDRFRFGLKAVTEEEDDDGDYSEEENALIGYEDEDEGDADTSLQSSSSFDSEEDLPRSFTHLQNTGLPPSPTTPKPQVFTPPRSGHIRRATLSKTWTFPFHGQQQMAAVEPEEKEVDRFFGCLDDPDSDTSSSVPNSPSAYSYEKSKGLFSSGFKFAPPDDNASFFLPDGVGQLVDDDAENDDEKRLSVVAEAVEEEAESETEVEDEEDMFGEIGGIRITFTPPQEDPEPKEERKQIQISSPVKRTSPPPVLPALNFGEDEDDEEDEQDDLHKVIPFNFGRPLMDEREPSPPPSIAFPIIVTPPASLPRPASPSMIPRPTSPSSIPRAVSSRSMSSSSSDSFSSPPSKVSAMRAGASTTFSSNSYMTPPTKRGGALPSFIPQPVSSPSPIRSMAAQVKPRVIPTSTFIRQPIRKPLLPSVPANSQNGTGSPNVPAMNAAINSRCFRRSPDDHAALPAASFNSRSNTSDSSAQMKGLSHGRNITSQSSVSSNTSSSSLTSIMSSPLSGRLSFQTLTNFIPLSWSSSVNEESRTAALSHSHHATDSASDHTVGPVDVVRPPRAGAYVSREKQLRLLKARMEAERVVATTSFTNGLCRRCDRDLVLI